MPTINEVYRPPMYYDIVLPSVDVNILKPAPGGIIAKVPLTPNVAPRLRLLASCFQEMRWVAVEFTTVQTANVMTTGSTVPTFCADPADEIPTGSRAIAWATANAHKALPNPSPRYYETSKLRIAAKDLAGPYGGWFKTNEGLDTSVRLSSPGYFALITDIPPNQSAPVKVVLGWQVEFRGATLNPETAADAVDVTTLQNFGIQGNATADAAYVPALKVFGTTTRNLTPQDFSPPAAKDTYYLLPAPVTIVGNTGASGAPQSILATHIGIGATANTMELYRYRISDGVFERAVILAAPDPESAPTFRSRIVLRPDNQSPSIKPVGF
jgi:hypothetical protein